jgi:glycosyltransferase involved in cell wall biosynthesis
VLPYRDGDGDVEAAVREATAGAELVADAHEVLVVGDGTRDGTRTRAEALAAADPRVRVVAHGGGGYGAAVRNGLRAARMPWVLLTDALMRFDPSALRDVLGVAPENDLLIGRPTTSTPRMRRAFGRRPPPVSPGFQLVRRSALTGIRLTSDGEMVATELLTALSARGARIAEVGPRPARPPRSRPRFTHL